MVKRILGYARVSSEEQAINSRALEQQKARLTAAGAEEILEDVESGAKDDRPSFQQLLKMVRSGECSEVVITKLDRITRSLLTLRSTIQILIDANVRLRVLDDSIDTKTAAGRFHINIMGSVAEMELDQLRERVLHGKRYGRQQKHHFSCPFGYRLEEGSIYPNNAEYRDSGKSHFQVAREAIDLFLNSGNLSQCIRTLSERYGGDRVPGHWSVDFARDVSGFKRWLLNPVLRGGLAYNVRRETKIEYQNTHPYTLLNDQEYRQIVDLLKASERTKTIHRRMINPLAGLMVCAGCGAPMFTSNSGEKGKRHAYILCSGAYPRSHKPQTCDRRSAYGLKMEHLVELAIAALDERRDELLSVGWDAPEVEDTPEIQDLLAQIKKIEALNDPDLFEAIESKRAKIQLLRHQLQTGVAGLEGDRQELIDLFPFPLEMSSFEELRTIFLRFIHRAICDRGQVNFQLRV